MNRWTLSLHEAGHAVAASVLTGTRAIATLHDGGGGAAWPLDDMSPTDRAIMTAVGPLAEALAHRHPAPGISRHAVDDTPSPALPTIETIAGVEMATDLRREMSRVVPDHVALARFCVAGIENQPERWAQRHAWIQSLAKRLISTHEKSIVKTARVLYLRGVVSVPLEERNAS
ncbi:MAG: hypothetical protein RBS39_06400 [Phycisphaerales bacterium]|nr:hypothetical protein [Phycisphaerales bacterium]